MDAALARCFCLFTPPQGEVEGNGTIDNAGAHFSVIHGYLYHL